MMEIKEEIRAGRVMSKEVVEAAANELAKKRNEKLTKEMMRITVNAEYERKRKLLDLQMKRDEEPITKTCLKAKEANELAVKDGKMTPEEFDKANSKADREEQKALEDVRSEYRELREQLHTQCYAVLNDWD